MTNFQRPFIREKDRNKFATLYGNGVVYVSDGERLSELPHHNFDIVSLDPIGYVAYWLTDGVAVAVGSCTDKAHAISALTQIIRQIQSTPKRKFNPVSPV
jgi:hypothetical protein